MNPGGFRRTMAESRHISTCVLPSLAKGYPVPPRNSTSNGASSRGQTKEICLFLGCEPSHPQAKVSLFSSYSYLSSEIPWWSWKANTGGIINIYITVFLLHYQLIILTCVPLGVEAVKQREKRNRIIPGYHNETEPSLLLGSHNFACCLL